MGEGFSSSNGSKKVASLHRFILAADQGHWKKKGKKRKKTSTSILRASSNAQASRLAVIHQCAIRDQNKQASIIMTGWGGGGYRNTKREYIRDGERERRRPCQADPSSVDW